METTLGKLLVGDCEHILSLNHLVATYSYNLILYIHIQYIYKKAMRQAGLLLDDNRDVVKLALRALW